MDAGSKGLHRGLVASRAGIPTKIPAPSPSAIHCESCPGSTSIVDHTADVRLDVLELTHSSWSWGATNRTYLITVVRKQHDPEIETHPKWTLDLRGYTADW